MVGIEYIFIATVIYVMFCHYVADFVMQTSWMANGKSKSLKPLMAHIAVYTLTLIIMGIPLFLMLGFNSAAWLAFCVLNGLCHFATDFVTSKLSSKAYADKNIRLFWIIIGFDQFIHIATFWLILGLLLAV